MPEAWWEGSSSGAERSLVTAAMERDVVQREGLLTAAGSHVAETQCAGQSGGENETLFFLQFQGNMCWDPTDQTMAREEVVVTIKPGAACRVLQYKYHERMRIGCVFIEFPMYYTSTYSM